MERTIEVASAEEAVMLFGLGDRNLKLLRDSLDVELTARGRTLRVTGPDETVEEAASLLGEMVHLYRQGAPVRPDHLERQLEARLRVGASRQEAARPGTDNAGAVEGGSAGVVAAGGDGAGAAGFEPEARSVAVEDRDARPTGPSGPIEPTDSSALAGFVTACSRSPGQETYIKAILDNEIVFCIGPAGTGKTYLAVRVAVQLLRAGDVRRIILCRPAVEAGEKLGFLPGDFQAKINPYLRPLHDALGDILDYDQVKRYMEREIIEIIPLAYMRGRTLNDAFIILDEGQNTTVSQMKMFLTRMGMNSRIVVNGDVTQVDLPEGQLSGLIHAQKIIRSVPGISWVKMGKVDIVRHPLVKKIVEAYESATRRSRK